MKKIPQTVEVGADTGMALQMAASSLRIQSGAGTAVYMNDPGRPDEYDEFQRRVPFGLAL